ncbi:MAG TPA: UDP-3-O-(3-hydroxymyristoyl)glucosamine N-acyltransferase [Bacillota bacterium]|jgi:UDP-3-O-[3-hydroxymyristoyl] glucosamine N-acyltransferase|nr:UDP-3-O-(3-hydroxymyristoyl)glucosamine N-acyltransferase [Bacillota bacterium]HOL09418.1 UDP-3-O-(3-hydroxymyristoyl)glucosamine N-acyltransferase [Bacillota bacterium]HPO97142.1 UDP-3-O-(3-hydroxymyristoyl)glucosamine N-acyltransferase [Bacillota bacterium]
MTTLAELAKLVNGEIIGDGNVVITGVAGIDNAKDGDITLVASLKVLERAINSQAVAIIIPETISEVVKPAIRVKNPRLAFAILLNHFNPPKTYQKGIDSTAVIGSDFKGDHCTIGPLVFIGNQVTIGSDSVIMPGAIIEDGVQIGSNCIIHSNVVIRENCIIGNNVQIHAGTVIGADGFGYVTVNGKHYKVPQVGIVQIEDDVEIGACVTIDRATTGVTLVKRGTKIDNLVQVAHNCQVGEDNIIIAQAALAGSTKLGNRVTLAGKSGVIGHLNVGDDSVVAACSLVINNLAPNSFVSGFPARPHATDMRIQAAAGRLPELLKEFKELQKKVAELEQKLQNQG